MARVHELFQALWPPIGVLGGERLYAIIAPVPLSRELRNGHELNSADAEAFECVQVRYNGRKGARRSEGADMEFVEDVRRQGETAPLLILPGEVWLDHLRGTVHVLGLATRGWIRALDVPIQPVRIQAPRLHVLDQHLVVPCDLLVHRDKALSRGTEVHI